MSVYNQTLPLRWGFLTAVFAVAAGYLAQQLRTNFGHPLLSPSYLLAVLLVAVAVVLLITGLQLRKRLLEREKRPDPFVAVRLLAASRAGQILGAFWTGFGLGLFIWVAPRLAETAAELWLPMVALLLTGALLWVIAPLVERMCKVPPGSDDGDSGRDADPDTLPDVVPESLSSEAKL
ncbi:DUF3180 domain-containing protein [Canibacter zhoujuaniae]|uniref:DUF3180 domain-containing protein n=1 Tax=Canibacter zhoujuaniae TaxID=2708343 RepID=UPI00142016DB|nr:DUF3180 domain-containing protein [Canibacter zhoujuaniae]